MKFLFGFAMLWAFAAAAQDGRPTDPNARDILILTDWFEGEFDNEEQRWFFARNGGEGDPPHRRIHAIHTRLSLPEIGEHVFHIQHYLDDDPSNVVRQRIGIFASEPGGETAIRMKQGFYKDNDRARDAHLDPSKLDGLTMDDITFVEGCDLFWVRGADNYVANMKPKACTFGEGELHRYSVHTWTVSATRLFLVDSSFLLSDDSLYVGLPVDQPFRMRRAKIFECEATFSGEQSGPARTIKGIRLHSQGGLAWFDPDENGDVYGIRLHDAEFHFYSQRPDFLWLSFRKKGEARQIGYGLADVDARRIGFGVGWATGHCHLEGYEFREPLDMLR